MILGLRGQVLRLIFVVEIIVVVVVVVGIDRFVDGESTVIIPVLDFILSIIILQKAQMSVSLPFVAWKK